MLRFYTLFNRQCLNTGTNKREKQFFDLKVQSVALQSSSDSTKSIAHVLYTRAKQIDGVVDNKETIMVLVWQLHELHFIILRDVSICPYGIEYAKVIPQNLDNFMKWGVGLGMNVVRKMMEDGRKWLKNLEINKIMLIFAS